MVEFRKRLDDDILSEINEMIIEYNKPDDSGPGGKSPGDDDSTNDSKNGDSQDEPENKGMLTLDATCA